MKCPKCDSQLNKVKIKTRPEYGADVLQDAEQTGEIELDQCLSCNGVWFDVNELDQYLAEKLIILNSPKVKQQKYLNKKDGPCPRCNLTMVKKPAPKGAGFAIDVCEKCQGVWLDSTEIDKLEEKNWSTGEKHAVVFRNFKELFFNKGD
ncbi:MAG: zf-TFIIB domain-containing protein [Candidatus Omnitrophica bacterium]|nr:zf-TFIIB domain-containing protein [Candidatus Omnitrophota bacterium]